MLISGYLPSILDFKFMEMMGDMTEKASGMASRGVPNATKAPSKDADAAATRVTA